MQHTASTPKASVNVTDAPPSHDSGLYRMDHLFRGKAVIFNQENFWTRFGISTRFGSAKDRDDLAVVLQQLKFEVKCYNDLTKSQIKNKLAKREYSNLMLSVCFNFFNFFLVAAEDHSNSDCVLVAIMTHGVEDFISAYDDSFETHHLWKPFTPEKCPKLAGKPKIFIIQVLIFINIYL
jgi:caspase 7